MFFLSIVTLAIALTGVVASPTQPSSDSTVIDFDLSSDTNYNAATAPWEESSHPGWYYGSGKPQVESNEYPCIGPGQPVRNSLIIFLLF